MAGGPTEGDPSMRYPTVVGYRLPSYSTILEIWSKKMSKARPKTPEPAVNPLPGKRYRTRMTTEQRMNAKRKRSETLKELADDLDRKFEPLEPASMIVVTKGRNESAQEYFSRLNAARRQSPHENRDWNLILDYAAPQPRPDGTFVVRGLLRRACYGKYNFGRYQRQEGSNTGRIGEHMKKAQVQDTTVCVRNIKEMVYDTESQSLYIIGEPYVTDGGRRFGAGQYLEQNGDALYSLLGAMVFLNTTENFELNQFLGMNTEHKGIARQKLLQITGFSSPSIRRLEVLCKEDPSSALYGIGSWGDGVPGIFTCNNIVRTIDYTHRWVVAQHPGEFKKRPTSVRDLAKHMETLCDKISEDIVIENTETYWRTIREVFPAFNTATRNNRDDYAFVNSTFHFGLGLTLALHEEFWEGPRLVIPKTYKESLATYDHMDETIIKLSQDTSSRVSVKIDAMMSIRDHLNYRRSANRLTPRMAYTKFPMS